MEFCGGGDLFERISALAEGSHFSEQKAAVIMKQLLLAINHCHSNGIIHRDLKPENILFKEGETGGVLGHDDVKIIDFGLSKMITNPTGTSLKSLVGTPCYVAPEVLDGQYGKECDCWSLGVIMYSLLSGRLPFFSQNARELYDSIHYEPVNFDFDEFADISAQAKDLITKLLAKDKKERFTCTQAIHHEWFEFVHANEEKPFDNSIIDKLRAYRDVSVLKKEALHVLVKMLDE